MTSHTDTDVWTKGLPNVKGSQGIRTYTYEAVALKKVRVSPADHLEVDLIWYPKEGAPQKDRLKLQYSGTPISNYEIRRHAETGKDASVYYYAVSTSNVAQRERSRVSLVKSALGQPRAGDEADELSDLSKEELIALIKAYKSESQQTGKATVDISTEPVIVYYDRSTDATDVASVLRENGYDLQIQDSVIAGQPTNSVWFGVDVPVEEARRVAETLIREGVELQYFGPFAHEGAKTNRIEIGTDVTVMHDDVLSLEMVRSGRF